MRGIILCGEACWKCGHPVQILPTGDEQCINAPCRERTEKKMRAVYIGVISAIVLAGTAITMLLGAHT